MSIIKIENLSKKYIIGHDKAASGMYRYSSLRDSIAHTCRGISQRIRHPFSPNTETTALEEFWALKDINLEIEQGDKIGIIGRNGAGKSTLLKILSRITEPTTGKFTIKGRIASLLEVGTGFHPELSGRENIYLNGAILGMTRKEIKKKFDEIVDFSGVEKFLDTPVKRYSSGMYVRLAFAVAAHLDPEILLIDEVLAVGDAEFQKKCLGKMEDVSKQGRTILFVSHNMAAIKSLCSNCIYLKDGKVKSLGPSCEIIQQYLKDSLDYHILTPIEKRKDRAGMGEVKFTDFKIISSDTSLKTGKSVKLIFTLKVESPNLLPLKNISISTSINSYIGEALLVFSTNETNNNFDAYNSRIQIICEIDNLSLSSGDYYVNLYMEHNGILSDYIINAYSFNVDDSSYYPPGFSKHPQHPQCVIPHRWSKCQS